MVSVRHSFHMSTPNQLFIFKSSIIVFTIHINPAARYSFSSGPTGHSISKSISVSPNPFSMLFSNGQTLELNARLLCLSPLYCKFQFHFLLCSRSMFLDEGKTFERIFEWRGEGSRVANDFGELAKLFLHSLASTIRG